MLSGQNGYNQTRCTQNDDSGLEDTTASEDGAPAVQPKEPKAEAKTSSGKKKKKRKQKQKKASGAASNTGPSVAAKQTSKAQPVAPHADEDIDQLLASLNITQAAVPEASTSGRTTIKARPEEPVLLGVNPSKLKADDEMRRIFGSRVVDAEAKNDQAGGMVGGSRRVRRYKSHCSLAYCNTAGSVCCCPASAYV